MSTLVDFLDWAAFALKDDFTLDAEAKAQHLSQDKSREFKLLAERLSSVSDFNIKTTEEAFRSLVEELGIKAGDLVHPVRVALTGKAVGPGLFDTMVVLGKEKTVTRLSRAF